MWIPGWVGVIAGDIAQRVEEIIGGDIVVNHGVVETERLS
jgi:hypothetical protein